MNKKKLFLELSLPLVYSVMVLIGTLMISSFFYYHQNIIPSVINSFTGIDISGLTHIIVVGVISLIGSFIFVFFVFVNGETWG